MTDPDDDIRAAEYVLGTLDAEERSGFLSRFETDAALRTAVSDWEERFSPLVDLYPPVPVPPDVWDKVARRIDDLEAASIRILPSNVLSLERSIVRWRIATAGVAALAAALLAWIVIMPSPSEGGRFVAVLQKDATSPAMVLDVDVASRRAVIRQVSTERPADKSYELWLINPEVGGPRSLGILRSQGITKASLETYDPAVIARATYAITLEPLGGSPTGAPSGQPILSGKLVDRGS